MRNGIGTSGRCVRRMCRARIWPMNSTTIRTVTAALITRSSDRKQNAAVRAERANSETVG